MGYKSFISLIGGAVGGFLTTFLAVWFFISLISGNSFVFFDWKLFHSSESLINKQVELCVADKNTEVELLEPRYYLQKQFGSNKAGILRKLIIDEIMGELDISEKGFNALSSTEQNRLMETWDTRPYIWEESPELSFTEEGKESIRNLRKLKIRLRSEKAEGFLKIVAKEIAENEEIKKANQRRVEANKQARKEDAVWNSLEKEKRLEVCLPEIQKRTRELYFFSRVDRYLSNFKREVVAIQVVR